MTSVEIEPVADQLENHNSKASSMGTLCWGRWDIATRIFKATIWGPSPDPDKRAQAEEAVSGLEASADSIIAEVDALKDLPADVQPFADEFTSNLSKVSDALESAPDMATQAAALDRMFTFAEYPAVDAYEKAASASADCENL